MNNLLFNMHGMNIKMISKKLNFRVYLTRNWMLQHSALWRPANCYKFTDVSGGGIWRRTPSEMWQCVSTKRREIYTELRDPK